MTADSSKNERYNARAAEARWQSVWDERGIFATKNDDPRPKYYVLEMFPYPSGRIHMGHVRNYTMGDVVARFKRAMGNAVLHPMGWDAFGMPAENAAIDRKVHPKAWTYDNIASMKAQLKSMGLSLDWAREIATCDPAYYRHQQKMFLDFLKAGLVERKQSKVNWDPVDHTVLANEQVIDGRGWRSGAVVEQRELTQWFFKISDYSEDLLEALDTLDRWPEKVRLMQKNWIGRSEGLLLRFILDPATAPNKESELEIFTTRPDTLFGAKFMAISPDHPLAAAAAAKNPSLASFIEQCRHMGTSQAAIDTAEKMGFDTGIKAIHPFDANWKLPVYVANFILMDYGTGAIFGCPAHDQRDLDFVNKYGLGNTPVVCPEGQDPKTFVITTTAYDGDGRMINSRFLDGMTIEQAKEEVARRLEVGRQSGVPDEALRRYAERVKEVPSGIARVIEPDRPLVPGVELETDLGTWSVHATPGHAPSHVCLLQPERRLMISGDHLLGRISLYYDYGWTPDPAGEFLRSLDVVDALEARLCLAGHGRPFTDVRAHIDGNRALVNERLEAVLTALAGGGRTAVEIVPDVYGEPLSTFNAGWLLAQTLCYLRHLELAGRVERDAGDGGEAERWRTAA